MLTVPMLPLACVRVQQEFVQQPDVVVPHGAAKK